MKNILRWLLFVLLVQMNCCASVPTIIINTANPLFQPKYQLVTYTGTFNVTLPQGYTSDAFLMTQQNINLLGFLEGSLVGNGYSTNYQHSTQSTQPVQIGLSGTFNTTTQNNAYSAVGITDLTELCQRYSGYVAFFQYFSAYYIYWGLQAGASGSFLSLPASIRLSESDSTDPSKNVLESFYLYAPGVKSILTVMLPKNSGDVGYSLTFNSYNLVPFLVSEQQKNIFSSIIKNEKYPSVFGTPLSFGQNALPQFLQLQNWFTTNINIQFSLTGFPSSNMPSGLMSMQGVNPTQPYSVAYKNMLDSVYTLPVSLAPTSNSFTLPALFGAAAVTQYNQVFGNDTFFVPFMMADPLWTTAAAQSSANTSGFTTSYEYPQMKLYAWQQQQNSWVPAEVPAQKVGYAGDVTTNAGGGITLGTDFDPRKSPMSDFYTMLSF